MANKANTENYDRDFEMLDVDQNNSEPSSEIEAAENDQNSSNESESVDEQNRIEKNENDQQRIDEIESVDDVLNDVLDDDQYNMNEGGENDKHSLHEIETVFINEAVSPEPPNNSEEYASSESERSERDDEEENIDGNEENESELIVESVESGDNIEMAKVHKGSELDESNTKKPAAIKILKEHQVDAVQFLIKNCIAENSGCIIAHHMGLGKTLTTVKFLNEISTGPDSINTALILTPKSTIKQWINESKTVTGNAQNADCLSFVQLPEG